MNTKLVFPDIPDKIIATPVGFKFGLGDRYEAGHRQYRVDRVIFKFVNGEFTQEVYLE